MRRALLGARGDAVEIVGADMREDVRYPRVAPLDEVLPLLRDVSPDALRETSLGVADPLGALVFH